MSTHAKERAASSISATIASACEASDAWLASSVIVFFGRMRADSALSNSERHGA